MTDEQRYYEYNAGSALDWHVKTPPVRDLHFERELELFGGKNPFGQPVYRIKWAGTLKSDVAFKDTLKYKTIWEGLAWFKYEDEDGTHRIFRIDDAPDGKFVLPVYKTLELGKLRWVVEKWMSIEQAMAGGRFDQEAKAEDGLPLYRTPPQEGVYNAVMFIQSAEGHYRGLDAGVLESVKAELYDIETATIDQRLQTFARDEQRAIKQGKEQAYATWQG